MPPPVDLPALVVPHTDTDSNVIDFRSGLGTHVRGITIHGPATLAEVATIQVSNTASGTFRALQSGGSDLTVAQAKSVPLYPISFGALKIKLDGPAGAERTFLVTGVEDY